MSKISADLVRKGDTIRGLDNAYVIDVETTEVSTFTGRDNYYLLGLMTVVTYNDAMGEECYLILPPASEVSIEPEDGSDPFARTHDDEES